MHASRAHHHTHCTCSSAQVLGISRSSEDADATDIVTQYRKMIASFLQHHTHLELQGPAQDRHWVTALVAQRGAMLSDAGAAALVRKHVHDLAHEDAMLTDVDISVLLQLLQRVGPPLLLHIFSPGYSPANGYEITLGNSAVGHNDVYVAHVPVGGAGLLIHFEAVEASAATGPAPHQRALHPSARTDAGTDTGRGSATPDDSSSGPGRNHDSPEVRQHQRHPPHGSPSNLTRSAPLYHLPQQNTRQ